MTNLFPREAGPVTLRLITLDELLWFRAKEDAEGFQFMTCRPLKEQSLSEKTALYRAALENADTVICGLWLNRNRELIGKISATGWNLRNRSGEIGYFLLPQFRKKGYMKIALQSFCGMLFSDLGYYKILAQTGSFNVGSIQLLEKLGFQRDGVLRAHHEIDGILWDDYTYSLLSDEFKVI